jgi:hypothetical protein
MPSTPFDSRFNDSPGILAGSLRSRLLLLERHAHCSRKNIFLSGGNGGMANGVGDFSHEESDEKVKRASVNYFSKLHDVETTCSRVLVM